MDNDEYGGAAGGGYVDGGGYMQQGAGIGSPDRGGGVRRPQHLTPVTIRQLLDHSTGEDTIRIDGKESYYFKIVGMIVHISKSQSGSATYTLDDGTGQLDTRIYIESGDGGAGAQQGQPSGAAMWLREQQESWSEWAYATVVGYMRTFQERKTFQATRIRLVQDHNEIAYHLLDVIHTHLGAVRGAPAHQQFGYTDAQYGVGQSQGGYDQMAVDQTGYAPQPHGGNPLTEAILNILRKSDQQGVHIADIVSQLNYMASDEDIKGQLVTMLAEGFVFNTMTEEMFKNT